MMDLGQLEANRADLVAQIAKLQGKRAHIEERIKALQILVDRLGNQIVEALNTQESRLAAQGILADSEPVPSALDGVFDEDMDASEPITR